MPGGGSEFNVLMCLLRDKVLPAILAISGGSATPPTTENGVVTSVSATGSGTVAAGKYSVSVLNAGSANGTFNGQTILPSQSITLTGYYDNFDSIFYRLPAIAYDGTGTTLSIIIQD